MSDASDHPERDSASCSLTEDILCPRCGYDLRGVVNSWRETCPMEGTCAECGLDFEWWWMFRAQFHPWLFEHQWRKRPLRSCAYTLWASVRPAICRQISLIHPIRLAPLVALLVSVVLASLIMQACGLAYASHQLAVTYVAWKRGLAGDVEFIMRRELEQLATYMLPVIMLPPLAFALIPVSLQRVKVRPAHIARIWLYSLIGAGTFSLFVVFIQTQWNLLAGDDVPMWMHPTAWRMIPWSPDSPWWVLVLDDTVRPIWIMAVIWTWWWWRTACRDYLRLPDATLTASLLMVIVVLASYLVQHGASVIEQFR